MGRCELIFYATPTGPLADACDRFFAEASEIGPTVAQTYPPHCTLTGFFRRTVARRDELVGEVQSLIDTTGPVPAGVVIVDELRVDPRWIGLALTSPWLKEVVAALVDGHRLDDGDDALRPKDWLHLSLAYGIDDLGPYRSIAGRFDPELPAGWELALWERHPDQRWARLTTPPR